MRTHNPQYVRSEYYTQLAKMSFDKMFDLTAGVYFNFFDIPQFYWSYLVRSNDQWLLTCIPTAGRMVLYSAPH